MRPMGSTTAYDRIYQALPFRLVAWNQDSLGMRLVATYGFSLMTRQTEAIVLKQSVAFSNVKWGFCGGAGRETV